MSQLCNTEKNLDGLSSLAAASSAKAYTQIEKEVSECIDLAEFPLGTKLFNTSFSWLNVILLIVSKRILQSKLHLGEKLASTVPWMVLCWASSGESPYNCMWGQATKHVSHIPCLNLCSLCMCMLQRTVTMTFNVGKFWFFLASCGHILCVSFNLSIGFS